MELKVWVEGIQRVVCGVSDSTTCQDIVYALAHATGQTGRFTLVERWRHNERFLPPHEHPLKVLTKWGEYASNVQFILRRSDKKSSKGTASGQSESPSSNMNKRQHEPAAPMSPAATSSSSSNKELKKSFTFSGSHGGSCNSGSEHSAANSVAGLSSKAEPNSSSSRSALPNVKTNRQDIPRGIIKGVQQSPVHEQNLPRTDSSLKSKVERPKQPPSYDEAVSRSLRHITSHLAQPPQAHLPRIETDSPSTKRRHLTPNRTIDTNIASPSLVKNERNTENESSFNLSWDNTVAVSPLAQDSNKNFSGTLNEQTRPISKSRKNLIGQFEKDETGVSEHSTVELRKESKADDSSLNQDPQLRDLIRLVNLQKEKLSSQNSELTQYDSEIGYWESRLQEREEHLASLEDELHRLERTNREHEDELEQLELHQPMLIESIDKGRQEDRALRSKLSVLRAQVANCETEVLQCRQRMRNILEEIAEERKRNAIERSEREIQIKNQLQELEDQLLNHKTEAEKQKHVLAKLEEELKHFDSEIIEKSVGAEKLTEELREENLQSLSLATTEDMKCVAEGNFHNRSGSTRRIMGSPRQLENAVPTSKNPHGVWV